LIGNLVLPLLSSKVGQRNFPIPHFNETTPRTIVFGCLIGPPHVTPFLPFSFRHDYIDYASLVDWASTAYYCVWGNFIQNDIQSKSVYGSRLPNGEVVIVMIKVRETTVWLENTIRGKSILSIYFATLCRHTPVEVFRNSRKGDEVTERALLFFLEISQVYPHFISSLASGLDLTPSIFINKTFLYCALILH
jgi:hypothetical protein